MPTEEILKSLVIVLAASAATVFFLHKIKVPSLVGFLVAGTLIGPYGMGIAKDVAAVEALAEVGVILLLFTIGVEFSLARLARMKKAIIVGGGLQVLATIALAAGASYILIDNPKKAVFIGFLIAMSSTAIVLKVLSQRGETDSPHGRMMFGILIFQDLSVVLLMLLIPAMAGEGFDLGDIALKVFSAVFIIGLVLLSARWLVPGLLRQVVRTRSRELFITTIILLCIGVALFTSEFGLSLALGAFLAGLAISESEYASQATSDILPFKESFMGLFFVSVGMLLDVSFVAHNALWVLAAVAAVFGIKLVTGSISAFLSGAAIKPSVHVGLGLAHIGEFSFILAVSGRDHGILPGELYQLFLSASVLTMLATPFLLKSGSAFSGWVASRGIFKRAGMLAAEERVERPVGHVIIIGFGLNGRNLAKVLKEAGVPYAVLEMNSETVREMRAKGEPIYYGDGTGAEILENLGIESARLLVVAISDPASTRKTVALARSANREIYIIVRTRYIAEVDELKTLGANEVIPEEFETSIEIFSRVLDRYNFPPHIIHDMIARIRSDSYTALRSVDMQRKHLFDRCEWLPEIEIDGFRLPEGSPFSGKTVGEMRVRSRTGVTVIAVRRDGGVHTNPSPDFRVEGGDILLFTGDRKSMAYAVKYFQGLQNSDDAK